MWMSETEIQPEIKTAWELLFKEVGEGRTNQSIKYLTSLSPFSDFNPQSELLY